MPMVTVVVLANAGKCRRGQRLDVDIATAAGYVAAGYMRILGHVDVRPVLPVEGVGEEEPVTVEEHAHGDGLAG